MKKALIIDTLRQVWATKSRFLAIFAIIALGCGFFAGVKVTPSDMQKTAADYWDTQRLSDIHLISTLGFNDDDVAAIKADADIDGFYAGYSADLFVGVDDKLDLIVKAYSMDMSNVSNGDIISATGEDNKNFLDRPVLLEGRYPTAPDEILADVPGFSNNAIGLGSTISFRTKDEDRPIEDILKLDTFTVVGIVKSPIYVSFERGSTTIGNGVVDAFVILPQEAFNYEAYTDIYATLKAASDGKLSPFDDEYKDYVTDKLDAFEAISKGRIVARTGEIEKELQDAEVEFADGEKKYNDGLKKYNDGLKEYNDGLAKYKDGEQKVTDGQKDYADGLKKYNDGVRELADGQKKYDDGLKKYNDGVKEYADGQKKYEDGQKEYDDGLKKYNDGLAEYESGRKEYNEGLRKFENGISGGESSLDSAARELAAGRAAYESGMAQYNSALAQWNSAGAPALAGLRAALAQAEAAVPPDPALIAGLRTQIAALESQKQQLDASGAQLSASLGQLEAGAAALEAGRAELSSKRSTGRRQLEESKAELDDARDELDKAKTELEDSKPELEDAKKKLADSAVELEDARIELEDARVELEDAKKKLTDAKVELDDAEKSLTDAEVEMNDAKVELDKAKIELDDAKIELDDATAELEDGRKKLSDSKADVEDIVSNAKWYCFDREYNPDYANYEVDAARIDSIARVFPVFFILVAALVCLTTMTRMVEEQRTKIGILKALGYSRFSIMGQYLSYAIVASVLGALLGVLIGFKLFPNIIFIAYQNMYVMPRIIAEFRWDYAILCITASVLCTGISVIAACSNALLSLPSQLMRPQPPKNGKRVILERAAFIWKRLSFNMKVTFRNVFRYKDRVLMTVVGIAGCTALIVAGFGLKYAIGSIVHKQYGEIFQYDVINILDDKASPELKNKLDEEIETSKSMSSAMYVLQKMADVSANGKEQEAYLFVPEDSAGIGEFITLRERLGKVPISLTDEGVVINEKLSKLLQADVGDSIMLEGARTPVTIADVTENYTYNYVYITKAIYEELYEVPVYNSFIANMAEGVTSDQLSEELLSYENILSVNYSDVAGTKFTDLVQSLNLIVLVLILCSGALAFVVLYNLANINVNERIRELATIKVLGFFDGEVSAYVYRESMISSTLGMLVGLVVGAVLEHFIVLEAEMDMIMFSHDIPPYAFIYSAVLTLFFAVVVNFTMHFKLKKIDMAASMKAIE